MVAFDFQAPAGLSAASFEPKLTPNEKKMDQEPGAGVSRKGSNFLSNTNKKDDAFTRLISAQNLTGKVIFFSLLVAFFLGAMHALSPGHGKAIVAGYLVGSRGTALHAVFLGAVVTLTHTIGVFALGILTLFGSRYILPETLYPWLGFLSGLSIVVIGLSLFRKRFNVLRKKKPAYFVIRNMCIIFIHTITRIHTLRIAPIMIMGIRTITPMMIIAIQTTTLICPLIKRVLLPGGVY